MKKTLYFILFLLIISCKKESVVLPVVNEPPVVVVPPTSPYTLTTTVISGFSVPNLTNDVVAKGVNLAISGVILYQKDICQLNSSF